MMPRTLSQESPYPDILKKLVEGLEYKEGWSFDVSFTDRGQGSRGLTLNVRIEVQDTYHPEEKIHVWHYMIVPAAAYNEQSWKRWLLDQILLIERHETCEFFQIDGDRPYAPHHGFGQDPYIVFDHGEDEARRTSYLNEVRETQDPG